jgi:glycosyltransferase involved in cell wall biosynthesis
MSRPLFSIIIPTYDRREQLAACLQSITALDYPPDRFEVIVVDDGSPQSPEDILKSFAEVIDLKLLRQPNAGPAAARNRGAASAQGDFLVFTDDDCLPDQNWLNAYAKQFSLTALKLIGGQTVNAAPRNLCSSASQSVIDSVYRYFNTKAHPLFFATNNLAVPASTFRQLGGFNEQFRTSEDREFCDRWTQHGHEMIYAPQAVCQHRHLLNLKSFWRQHFDYGRGAFHFHRERKLRNGSRLQPDAGFYLHLLTSPFIRETGLRRLALTALVCCSQMASTMGFACELLRQIRVEQRARRIDATQIAK